MSGNIDNYMLLLNHRENICQNNIWQIFSSVPIL